MAAGGGSGNNAGMGASDSSSSGEEDGDAAWRAAIDSVAAVDLSASAANGRSKPRDADGGSSDSDVDDEQRSPRKKPRGFTLYQIKAQIILEEMLDKSLVMVRDPTPIPMEKPETTESCVRLFRKSPRGIILDPIDSHPQPRKRPQIIPGVKIDEKSKKFRRHIESTAVSGKDIVVSARNASQQALARLESKDAARLSAVKREEERVAKLKKLRGEKWLPSIARQMKCRVPKSKMGG